MKKLIVAIMLLGGGIIFSSNANKPIENIASFETCISQNVVFRSTQRLKANDGRQIYLYSSGKCELWDGDRLVVTATYRLQNGEVRLLDENGNTIYKGSYRLARDRRNISSLTLAGTTYYKMKSLKSEAVRKLPR